jgi:hypothetical protein
VYDYLRSRGFSNYTISRKGWNLGVVEKPLPGHERFEGALTIPYRTADGRECGIKFRWPYRHTPKYDSVGLDPPRMFAVKFTYAPVVYVVTGELNAITLHQLGLKGVGAPGDNSWHPSWRWLFRDCDEVIVVPDADRDAQEPGVDDDGRTIPATKGIMFRMKVMGSLRGLPPAVRVVNLPPGHDVNSLYLEDRKLLRHKLEGR